MADTIVAKNDIKRQTHPEGQFIAKCVDSINLGERVNDYQGNKSVQPTCALVFRTGERNSDTGDYIDISREFAVFFSAKANLRKFLEQWRGKPYSNEQADEGVPLHKMVDQWALITVAHKTSGAGNIYAFISACVGLPVQLQKSLPEFESYHRPEFWEKRKQEYAEEVRKFKGEHSNGAGANARRPFEDDEDSDSSLPF